MSYWSELCLFFLLICPIRSWRRPRPVTPVRSRAPPRCRRRWRRSSSTSSSCWPRGTWSAPRLPRRPATSARWRRSWASSRRSTCRYGRGEGGKVDRVKMSLGAETIDVFCLSRSQYVAENESTLQQVRALLASTQKDKLELANQLEEEKRWCHSNTTCLTAGPVFSSGSVDTASNEEFTNTVQCSASLMRQTVINATGRFSWARQPCWILGWSLHLQLIFLTGFKCWVFEAAAAWI